MNGQTTFYDNSLRFSGFSVGIALPIFGAGSTIAKTKAANINIEREQKNAGFIQSQVKSQFTQLTEQLKTYQELIDYYRTTAELNAKKIIQNATLAYQNGDISYVEYVQGIETALDIQLNYSEAISNYNQTVIDIQFLINQ